MMCMKERVVDKEELIGRLLKRFGENAPIFISEIAEEWGEYSRSRVFQLLREMLKDGMIAKGDNGIYYLPTVTLTGQRSVLGHEDIIDKRFIYSGDDIFGYYSGLSLLNGLHLTTQMPFRIELVTSNASATVRKIEVDGFPITVRRSKVKISKKNVYALMLLEAFTEMRRPLKGREIVYMKEFAESRKIRKEDVVRYSRYFPLYTMKSILDTGLDNVFTR
ncbi:MAG: hypothetical protein FWG58_03120 [Methanomassiliicoccaceae archaeon]|nr:hypothetical protein [Methanomassiliicoccaceae archaeon]